MLHLIRSRARLLLGLLVIVTLVLSVGFLTTHPTIKAHADDGSGGSVDIDANINFHGDDTTDYSVDSPVATTVPLTRWYDPTPPNANTYKETGFIWNGPRTDILDYGLHYMTTQTDGKDVKSPTAYAEGNGLGNLGYVFSTPQANTTGIFSCFLVNRFTQTFKGALVVPYRPDIDNVGQKFDANVNFQVSQQFVSTDSGCEGQTRDPNFRTGPLGYISTVELPNSQPIYRCYITGPHNGVDHFLTHDGNCEGAANAHLDGPIGWTLNSPA